MGFKKPSGHSFGGKTPRRVSPRDDKPRFGDRPPRSSSRGSFDKKPFGKSFDKRGPELFDATCAKCGKHCQVPFRPTAGGKPVLCRECFRGDDGGRDFGPRKTFSSSSGPSASELAEINEKLDKIIKALNIE